MKRLSVRWRLTIWYVIALTAIVSGFGVCVYVLMWQFVAHRVDSELAEELRELEQEIQFAQNHTDLQQQLHKRFRHHGGFEFQVVDSVGEVLFRSERLQNARLPAPLSPTDANPFVRVYQDDQLPGLGQVQIASVLVDSPVEGLLLIQAAVPNATAYQELASLRIILLATGPLAILAALAGGYWLARHSLAPVERMALTAEQVTILRPRERIPIDNPNDELGQLARTLNGMLGRIEESVTDVRQFTADAAHELRTPLSVLQTEAEVALRMPRTADEYRHVIEVALQQTKRLTQLTEQLLTLSQFDANKPPRMEPVQLDALIRDVIEQFEPLAEEKSVSLCILATQPVIVAGDDLQLGRLLYNILDNAVKFAPQGGNVEVACRQLDPSVVEVTVRDSGPGIAPEDLPHVMKRFYRADKSRGTQNRGAGLGLAICKAISEAHAGSIRLESQLGDGTIVTVEFPGTNKVAPAFQH